jgi:hypothetical protein
MRGHPKRLNIIASHTPKTKLGKSGKHRSDIDFKDPFERASLFLNNRGHPKQWILVASHIPKTKLCKIWKASK